jgi:hypothetical protein
LRKDGEMYIVDTNEMNALLNIMVMHRCGGI